MAKREGSSASGPRTRSRVAKEGSKAKVENNAREAENARRLEKLPPKVWEKILDELESNDLFPLALSCRYFRQKQKKLVARQSGPESGKPRRRLALKTTFTRWNFIERVSQRQLLISSFASQRKHRGMTDRRSPNISGAWQRFMATCLCCSNSSILQKCLGSFTSTLLLVMQVSLHRLLLPLCFRF